MLPTKGATVLEPFRNAARGIPVPQSLGSLDVVPQSLHHFKYPPAWKAALSTSRVSRAMV